MFWAVAKTPCAVQRQCVVIGNDLCAKHLNPARHTVRI